jgi:spoIIIJ-associated protein
MADDADKKVEEVEDQEMEEALQHPASQAHEEALTNPETPAEAVEETEGFVEEADSEAAEELLEASEKATAFVEDRYHATEELAQSRESNVDPAPASPAEAEVPAVMNPPSGDLDRDELLDYGTRWLEGLLTRLKLDLQVEGTFEGDTLNFNLVGADTDQVLGSGSGAPRSVEGLQTLVGEVLDTHRRSFEVYVDVDGYRQRRSELLESVADSVAADATRIERNILLVGLNSFERRIVHQALSDRKDVSTSSDGRGSFRKIRIEPS